MRMRLTSILPAVLAAAMLPVGLGATTSADAAGPAAPDAAATDLFFSEYVEGSSNNKALEIYNGTGAPVDLGAADYSVQMFFNGCDQRWA